MINTFRVFIGFLLILMIGGCSLKKPSNGFVVFKFQGKAKKVCVAGTFNNWSDNSHCLENQGGLFAGAFDIPPGYHEYLFVLDSKRWEPDPEADFSQADEFGTRNSILIVNKK